MTRESPLGDAQDPVAGRDERGVPFPVALERASMTVVCEAVEFDDEAMVGPERIDLATENEDVVAGRRQTPGSAEGPEPLLQLRSEGRLPGGVDQPAARAEVMPLRARGQDPAGG